MQRMDRETLEHLLKEHEDVLVVNVLPRQLYEEGHIPGTLNIPLQEPGFVERVRENTTGPEQQIVTYCAGPACDASRRAAEVLREAGFHHVHAYEGGMEEWRAQGKPIVAGAAAL